MVEMTCEEHDRQAASTQFVTHTVGRMLGAMQVRHANSSTEARQPMIACLIHNGLLLFLPLIHLQLKSTEINTRGFEALLNLVNNTANDSFDLYYGLFLYNQNATDELERLEQVVGWCRITTMACSTC